MSLIVLGINHNSAPVAVREKLAIGEAALPAALASLAGSGEIAEGALLSACNRTEVYALFRAGVADPESTLAEFLARWRAIARHEFDGHVYCYRDGAVANHLFSVAAGIDSMILGEPDIQRQVRLALDAAQSARTSGTVVNKLFQEALSAGKRVRSETGLARGAFSVGAAAVELATQIYGDTLAGQTVLVLGAGKMSEVTARHLVARGAPAVMVANRTYERARQLADQFGGEARHFDDLHDSLLHADIVICSTAAPHPVVTKTLIRDAMRARRNRPLFLIDIAVPRDVEAIVGDIDNVYLYNIDDLQAIVARDRKERSVELTQARSIIEESLTGYMRWWRSLEVAPLIVAVRERLEAERLAALAPLRAQFPDLPEHKWRQIDRAFSAMTAKLAHRATQAIRSSAEGDPAALDAIRRAYGLLDEAGEDSIGADARTQEASQS